MTTKGQLEAEVAAALTQFEKEYMGRGPTETRAFIIEDIVLVRLQGVLTPAERQLVSAQDPSEGRRLIKRMRTELLESARPLLETVVAQITGRTVISLHTDISTSRGERVIIFVLDSTPDYTER